MWIRYSHWRSGLPLSEVVTFPNFAPYLSTSPYAVQAVASARGSRTKR